MKPCRNSKISLGNYSAGPYAASAFSRASLEEENVPLINCHSLNYSVRFVASQETPLPPHPLPCSS